jgi:AcrR family transcriptional regulator
MTARRLSPPPRRTPGRPPGATSELTRRRILGAARICFARTGYAATTNKEIGEQAGVSPAAIYLYFDSKTALYMATVTDAKEELMARYKTAIADHTSVREGFRAFLVTSAEVHERDPSLAAFLSSLPVEMQRHDELQQAMIEGPSEIVEIVEQIVETGVKNGELPRAIAPQVVSMFVACALGFSLFAATTRASSLTEIIEAFNAMIEGTLFKDGKKAPGKKPRR